MLWRLEQLVSELGVDDDDEEELADVSEKLLASEIKKEED